MLDEYRTTFLLVKEHGFTFNDINNMTPFEFDLQSVLVMEYLENLKKLNKTKRF